MVGLSLFQGLTLMVKDHPNEFVWATVEEIPDYLAKGYVIVNEIKRLQWEKKFGQTNLRKA